MDSSIERIRNDVRVVPASAKERRGGKRRRFDLSVVKPDVEDDRPGHSEWLEEHPVGPAERDEAGARIDLTA